MGSLFKCVMTVVLAATVHRIFRIYKFGGGFAYYHQHHPGPCQEVEGINLGSEDFQTLSNGMTFISSGLRYSFMSTANHEHFKRHGTRGRMYLLDLHQVDRGVRELKISASPDAFNADLFAPHGLSVWEDHTNGRHVVFVVNHQWQTGPIDSRVEKFVYDPEQQTLVHQATYYDTTMTVVNDVQATGENSFYFTTCNYFRTVMGMMLEVALELSLNTLVHYDGQAYTVVDSGLKSANGVALSSDGRFLYAADTMSKTILVYKRNQNNTLTRTQEYPIYTFPDNIQLDLTTGHLYVANHPLMFQFYKYVEDISAEQAPSQILQLQVKDGMITSSKELMYDHGALLSGSSSAVVFEGTLLIGSVFDRLVTCKVQVPLFP